MAVNVEFSPKILSQGVPYQHNVEVAAASGAIQSVAGGIVFITKGTAAALTLAVPYGDGARLVIVSTTAAAHTVTIAAGFNGGGASKDVGTFGGAIGDGIVVVSYGGNWYVEPGGNTNVTLA